MKNTDSKIQKIINKLVSEEVIAHDFYTGCMRAMKKNVDSIDDIFRSIAIDEQNDHAVELAKWAKANGYSVPSKYAEYEKYAEESVVLQFRRLKRDQSMEYYIEEAIKAEKYAIDSYSEVLNNDKIELPYDLIAIVYKNFYEECEHSNKFTTTLLTVQANAELNGIQ